MVRRTRFSEGPASLLRRGVLGSVSIKVEVLADEGSVVFDSRDVARREQGKTILKYSTLRFLFPDPFI